MNMNCWYCRQECRADQECFWCWEFDTAVHFQCVPLIPDPEDREGALIRAEADLNLAARSEAKAALEDWEAANRPLPLADDAPGSH